MTDNTHAKEQALAEIAALIHRYNLRPEEVLNVAGAVHETAPGAALKQRFAVSQMLAWVGVLLIFSGLGIYIGMSWASLNSLARIIIVYGPGILCFILATAALLHPEKPSIYAKRISVLIVLSALFQPAGLFVMLEEFSTGGGSRPLASLLVFGALALQYASVFLRARNIMFLFFTLHFALAAFLSVTELLHIPPHLTSLVTGVSLMALASQIRHTPYRRMCEYWYLVGSVSVLGASFDIVSHSPFEVLYIVVTVGLIYLSTVLYSVSILASAMAALFFYISYFTHEHFVDTLGWPVCLMLLGAVFLGVSRFALTLKRGFARE